jgi:hypothetical protein
MTRSFQKKIMSFIVFFEDPESKREELKQTYQDFIINKINITKIERK